VAVDQQIQVAGQASAPLSYTVPNAIEAALLCVNATIDGTAASGGFLPTVEIVSDGGLVVARCPCFTTVAAGASAEVSWFRLRTPPTPATPLSLYQSTVLNTANIRSYWPLDETSGTTFADLGPSSRPLTITGIPALGQPPLITSGHSAVFSGAVDGVGRAQEYGQSATGYGIWPGDNSLTVIGWYKGTFSGATNPQLLCMDDNAFRFMQFRLAAGGQLEFITFRSNVAASVDVTSAGVINDGARHMVAGTFNGVSFSAKVYVDGVLAGSAVGTGSYAANTPKVTLAARLVGGLNEDPVGGTLDEFALFSRELSATEIASLFTIGTT
jgi:hypothetical protein